MKTHSCALPVEATSFLSLKSLRMMMRLSLGVYFAYMGLSKLLAIEEFMSALHGYGVPSPLPLNLIAIFIPALEVVCGVALGIHRFWRGAFFILIPLMLLFTGLILWRMNSIHILDNLPRCSVSFDCGCGNGIINACRKIVLNSLILIAMGVALKK